MQRRLFRICQTGAILKPAFVYQVASIRRINGPGGHDPIEHPHFWHESEMALFSSAYRGVLENRLTSPTLLGREIKATEMRY